MNTITKGALVMLLTPLVGAKLSREALEDPDRLRVDITVPGLKIIDADLRMVDENGIERFNGHRLEAYSFDEFKQIALRREDEDDRAVTYELWNPS